MNDETPRAPAEERQRRLLWVVVSVAILLGAVWDSYPLSDAEDRLRTVPIKGDGFAGEDVGLTPEEEIVLRHVKFIHRRYVFDGHEIYVTLIDGTENRHAVHDPGYCFRGAGWEMDGQKRLPVAAGQAAWFRAHREDERLEAMYWFSDGAQRYCSFPAHWWRTTARRVTLGRSGPEPVLVVLQCYEEPPDWEKLAARMIAELGL
ncbi:MAG: exosortase-associated EpsI family protein [Verrucomicrobiota bacterium]